MPRINQANAHPLSEDRIMNILKTLLPLVLLLSLLVVACQPQPTAVNIPEANKELVTYAVTGMT